MTRSHINALRTRRTGLILVFILITFLISRIVVWAGPAAQEAQPTAPPQPLAGQLSYAENCAPCHGATGQGDGPSAAELGVPPSALGRYEAIASRTWQELFDITRNGNMPRMMPPWKNQLSDQEIWHTVAYAWTLHTSADEAALGQAIYEANCATCHGADGKGTLPGAPDLSDFAVTSATSQATWAAAVANGKGAMPGFAGKLSEAEQRASLAYLRSLSLGGPLFRGPLASGAGVIGGIVTNATTGQPLSGAAVTLGIFDQSTMLEQRTATTDATGRYAFTELPTDPGIAFAARIEYPAGVPYSSDFVSLPAGGTGLDLPIAVYETTTDPGGIRAERVHFIVEFDPTLPGQALVAELLVFSLDGDRTYVGDSGGVLRFPLPAGATDLAINEEELGGRFEATADGFVDLLPLRPGPNVRQILYRYALPYTSGRLDLKRSLPYPAANVNALISDIGQQVTSPQLTSMGKRAAQDSSYFNLLGQNLAAGQEIAMNMTGLAAAVATTTATAGVNQGLIFLLVGLAAAIAAALVALPMLRRDRRAPTVPQSQEHLADALAQLDVAHEAGEVSEAAYRDQRLRLKAQLRDLMSKEGQG